MKKNIDDIITGKIIKIIPSGAIISFGYEQTAFLHVSEVSKQYIANIEDFFNVGDKITVKIIEIKGNKTYVSLKQVKEEAINEELKRKQFEDKIQTFLKVSNENQKSIQKTHDKKRGYIKKNKGKNNNAF